MENKLSFFVDLKTPVFYNRFSKSVKSKVIAFKTVKTLFLNSFQKSILVSTFPQIIFNQFNGRPANRIKNDNDLLRHVNDKKSNDNNVYNQIDSTAFKIQLSYEHQTCSR